MGKLLSGLDLLAIICGGGMNPEQYTLLARAELGHQAGTPHLDTSTGQTQGFTVEEGIITTYG